MNDARGDLLTWENIRIAVNEHPVPQFQIQQPPEAIGVIAAVRAMLAKNSLDCLRLK
jgi:hypothetical protein